MHRLLALSVALAGLPAWGAAQELIVNGHFHTDINGWTMTQGLGTQVWDPLDWQASPGSGSLRLTNGNTTANGLTVTGQCIPLTPSGTYEVGGHVRFPSPTVGGFGGIIVGWFDNPTCAGAPLATTNTPPVLTTTTNTWVESFTAAITAPPGTVAVGVGPGTVKLAGAGTLDALFDRVRFGPTGTTPVTGQTFRRVTAGPSRSS